MAMEDREFPCSVHVNESTGRLEVRTDTKVHVYSESENQMIIDTVVRLRDENAKLRELVREMYGATLVACGECWIGKSFNPAGCDNENCGNRKNYLAIRELGVDVEA